MKWKCEDGFEGVELFRVVEAMQEDSNISGSEMEEGLARNSYY